MALLRQTYVDKGAEALCRGGVSAADPRGDMLYDYDWTPAEAASAVIDGSGLLAEVERLREDRNRLRHQLDVEATIAKMHHEARLKLEEALRELEPFVRHTLGEPAPSGGWPYDVDSPMALNPRLRAALDA